MPGARLPPSMHVRVFAGFALGAFALAMVLAYPYSLREPLKTSPRSVISMPKRVSGLSEP